MKRLSPLLHSLDRSNIVHLPQFSQTSIQSHHFAMKSFILFIRIPIVQAVGELLTQQVKTSTGIRSHWAAHHRDSSSGNHQAFPQISISIPLSLLIHRETIRSPTVLQVATTAEHIAARLVETGSRSERRTAVTLRSILCPSHWGTLTGTKALAGFVGHVAARVRRTA